MWSCFGGWSVYLKSFEELVVQKKKNRRVFRLISLTQSQQLQKAKHYTPKWTMASLLRPHPPPLKNVFLWLMLGCLALTVQSDVCAVSYSKADIMLIR